MLQCPFFLFSGSIPVIWRQSENLRCAAFFLFAVNVRRPVKGPCPLVQPRLATKTIECKYFQTGPRPSVDSTNPTAGFCSRISNQDWPFLFVRLFPDAFSPFLSSSKYQSRDAFSSLSREGVLHSAENEGVSRVFAR